MKKKILILSIVILFQNCKDATKAQFNALSKKHVITQYTCDGRILNKWTSTGNVSNEEGSDGWFFEDDSTKKLIEVTGNLKIEVK